MGRGGSPVFRTSASSLWELDDVWDAAGVATLGVLELVQRPHTNVFSPLLLV